eukprot:TRINITY_DN487_c0_g1_i1.p1 TRINITY_DN487_c0_g1~~TRINITY_DN487_c0_g1_i1.p1  ORF type:complete len:748 (-),score=192.65 TRINITY_DN487_c0_g1_i1:3-2246(-)
MDNQKIKCDCGEEKCTGIKCSLKLFLNNCAKIGRFKEQNENIVEFFKRMNLISTHKLFPIWDHHYNATKNKMHKFVTSSKKYVEGVNYCRISAKTHPKVWQNVKKYLDCPDTSWSVVYVDQELSIVLKQKMLAGRWGNIAGAHERNALELLFQIGTQREVETVPFKHFLLAAHKFYLDFPAWKKIQQKADNIVIGDHKKVNKSFIEKWIRDILTSLIERMHVQVDKTCRDNIVSSNGTMDNMEDDVNGQKKLSDNMAISKQLAEGFFNVFAGLAYTLLPSDIPIIDMKQFQKPGAPSIEKKCDDLLFHWAGSSILSSTGEQAQQMLLGDNKRNGAYLIRISHHYLFLLATFGINKIINDDKHSKQIGPFIICYGNNGSFFEQLITYQVMHLTTISNQLNAIPELRSCLICNQLCSKARVCQSSFTSPLPTSNNSYNNNNNNRYNGNNNNNSNFLYNIQNFDKYNNNIHGSNDILSPEFSSDYEFLTHSFVSVNMNEGQEQPKRMKRERGDNIKTESLFNRSTAINTPIYCIDTTDPTVLSILQIKISSTPDNSLSDAVIKISYHDNRTYTVECEKIMYSSKCLVPFLGRPSPVETKILIINDPKIVTTHFLKYIPKGKVWCCGVIEADTSYEITPGKQIFTDPPMGDTVLVCLSKNDFTPVETNNDIPFNINSNFLNMDSAPIINFDNNDDYDFSFLSGPTSVNTSWMISSSKKSPLSSPRSPRSPLSTSGILNLNTPSINPLFSFN